METFQWMPTGYTLLRTPKTLSAQFGDGYRQDAKNGLNANLAQWDLTFADVIGPTAKAMDDFLSARGGSERFLFYSLRGGGERVVCICPKWDVSGQGHGQATVTATFIEVAA
jgi:phage-related protein